MTAPSHLDSHGSIVSTFRTRRDIACDTFIAEARSLLLFDASYSHSLNFDAIRWDLHGHIARSGAPKSSSISFKTAGSASGLRAEPLPGRFGNAVKAIVAQKVWGTRGAKIGRSSFQFLANAGRKLHDIMVEDGIAGDPTHLTRDHLDRCVARAGKSRRHVAQPLSEIARIWSEAGITPDLEGWKDQGAAAKAARSRLNPHKARESLSGPEVAAIADAFHLAVSPADQVATSILALLCCAPSRIGEVFTLPADVEVIDRPGDGISDDTTPFDEDLRFHFGLRWWPEKGGAPTVKFVPAEMVPVAQEALDRLRRHTQDARETAAWMMANPGLMPLPDHLENVRHTRQITTQELADLYSYRPEAVASKSHQSFWKRIETGIYCFDSVEANWRRQQPAGWPLLSDTSGVTYDRALMVSFGHQFSDTYFTDTTRVAPIGEGILGEALSSGRSGPSIFERLGIVLPDGSSPKISTHRIRHYLNTVAQRANVPQAHIAHWSGRKRVMQNTDYDHTDIDTLVDEIMRGKSPVIASSLPVIVDDADEATRAAMIRQNVTSTPIGFCLGDLRFEPCDKAGACVDCTRLVCVAGDRVKAENLRRDISRREMAVENFRQAEGEGRRVNPRARQAAEAALEHGRSLLEALSDPDNAGSTIRNADVASLPGFRQADRILQSSTIAIKKDKTR